MDKLRELLYEISPDGLIMAVLSDKKKTDSEITKVKIRPIVLKNKKVFQITEYIKKKVIHTNKSWAETCEYIITNMEVYFKQCAIDATSSQYSILVSKKGRVTVKGKKIVPKIQSMMHNRAKNYILKEGIPVDFLVELGVMNSEGFVIKAKYDKFRQINRFLEFVNDIIPRLDKEKELTIIDFGCGKSYLTFAIYYLLKKMKGLSVNIIGLDLKEDVIDKCNTLARKLDYKGLTFLKGDIEGYNDQTSVDMVVTLHACDTATDYALQKAVKWDASVNLSVPCCQHEINGQIENQLLSPLLKYGILKERISALLTDAVRAEALEEAGYDTQILEFIDMEHTPKNLLIRACKRKNGIVQENKELSKMAEELKISPTILSLLRKPL